MFLFIALFSAAAAVYVVAALPAPVIPTRDAWERIRWGRLFVALVYVSIAVMCFALAARTLHSRPDLAKRPHHEVTLHRAWMRQS